MPSKSCARGQVPHSPTFGKENGAALRCFYVVFLADNASCHRTVFVQQILRCVVCDPICMYKYIYIYRYTYANTRVYLHLCVYPCVNGAFNRFWDTVSFNLSPLMLLPCHWLLGPLGQSWIGYKQKRAPVHPDGINKKHDPPCVSMSEE